MRIEKVFAGCVIALMCGACSEEKPKRGLEVLPDMFHTPAHKSQTSVSTVLAGASASDANIVVHVPTQLSLPAGVKVRDEQPLISLAGRQSPVNTVDSPVLPTTKVLQRGRTLYERNCALCHGIDGNSSHAVMAPHFTGVPSLTGVSIAGLSDGTMYHIITHGRGRMASFSGQILPEERWAIVAYLRVHGRAQLANMEKDAVVRAIEGAPHISAATASVILEQQRTDKAILAKEHDQGVFAPVMPPPAYIKPTWDLPVTENHR